MISLLFLYTTAIFIVNLWMFIRLSIRIDGIVLHSKPPHWGWHSVPTQGRGPNADAGYKCVEMEDGHHMFTCEVVAAAKERAEKYRTDNKAV